MGCVKIHINYGNFFKHFSYLIERDPHEIVVDLYCSNLIIISEYRLHKKAKLTVQKQSVSVQVGQ